MNKELRERLKTAREYQKKAIMALFPESMEEHLRVIGREMKLMAAELVMGAVREGKETEKSSQNTGVKKVDIG